MKFLLTIFLCNFVLGKLKVIQPESLKNQLSYNGEIGNI